MSATDSNDELRLKISPAILAAVVRDQPTEDDRYYDEEPGARERHEAQRAMLVELLSSVSVEELLAGLSVRVSIRHGNKPIARVDVVPTPDGWRLEGFDADYSDWVGLNLEGD
jgi:hypothetical protein